ncbi:MAG: ABC transporter ATP-binding protein [Ilumatobacteraceae bacterium]|nr:ABC transporter ATP-binding protein [Ilumatobacteraceae bacterium]
MTDDRPVLEVSDLSVSFASEQGWVRVVEEVSFSVERGKILGIVGESGSGKSVSCLAAMGLLDSRASRVDASSRVLLEGTDLTRLSQRQLRDVRGDRIAMIFQEPMTSLNPAFTVGNQVAEGIRAHRGVSARQAKRRAVELLDLVGIPDPASIVHAYPHSLSGGMRQRVMIAMAVACEPAVLIADEPTTALDVTVQAQILDLLRSMRDDLGLAIVFITHDLGVIADVCDDVVVMYAGKIVERSDVDSIFETPQHPYSEGLLAAMPRLGSDKGALGIIPGRVPPPWEFPHGCRFEPRCPYSDEACGGPQVLRQVSVGHESACGRIPDIRLEGIVS